MTGDNNNLIPNAINTATIRLYGQSGESSYPYWKATSCLKAFSLGDFGSLTSPA